MGIQPIDLQTLYSQMEKVGKQQGAEQSGAVANREHQQEANRIEAEKRLNTVKSSESINNDRLTVDGDTNPKGSSYNQKYKKGKHGDESDGGENYIKDPKLGSRVDISG